jgi:hypothetical protein
MKGTKVDTCQQVLRCEAEAHFQRWMRGEIHAADCEIVLHRFFEADREHMVARLKNKESPVNCSAQIGPTNNSSPKLPSVGRFILVGQKLGLKANVVSKLYHAATSGVE